MPSGPPFVDPRTGTIHVPQIVAEVVPLAKLIALVAGVALVPFALATFLFGSSILGAVVAVLGQFVLAVGSGIVLMYVVARGIELAGE